MKAVGPGLLVAAAGIGAGDMIIGIQLGLDFNLYYILAVLFICLIKYTLTEGIARYQLVTGTFLIKGWARTFPKFVHYSFFAFFLVWSLLVAAALTSACGIAGSALFPKGSISLWGAIHANVACIIVYLGKYALIEEISKWLIFLMVLIVVGTASILLINGQVDFSQDDLMQYDRRTLYFAIAGAIGGSVTMLSYGYWIKERGWDGVKDLASVRTDLYVSYAITALFIIALMVAASAADLEGTSGTQLVLALANVLQLTLGPIGYILFKVAFWGVVFSSMVSVWSGVPYLFGDFWKGVSVSFAKDTSHRSKVYRGYLLYLTFVPIVLAIYVDAVRNVINYALISAVFVLGLTVSLLLLNRKKMLGEWGNTQSNDILLMVAVMIFAVLAIHRLWT
ncbi:MAG: Nramp family divalent metal transporter [Saprospiraceae bacterium]|nr:Nramp family divalent metal transporter [Saprospiraceae bacterium]